MWRLIIIAFAVQATICVFVGFRALVGWELTLFGFPGAGVLAWVSVSRRPFHPDGLTYAAMALGAGCIGLMVLHG